MYYWPDVDPTLKVGFGINNYSIKKNKDNKNNNHDNKIKTTTIISQLLTKIQQQQQ